MRRFIYICLVLFAVCSLRPGSAAGQSAPPGTDIFLAPLSVADDSILVGQPVNITSRRGYDNQPFFSFDDSFLLFTSADTSGNTDIYRYNIKSNTTIRITSTSESEYSPTIVKGTNSFSSVRVEADGRQRLWQFDLDGSNPRLVLTAVDSVGYHTWVDDNTLGLFVLGEPFTLRIADKQKDTDRTVASKIGRCLNTRPGTRDIGFVQIVDESKSWITCINADTGKLWRVVTTLPQSQDFAWTPGGDLFMADGSVLFVWTRDTGWTEVTALGPAGLTSITRLAVSASGRWLALVAEDS
jgi:hypothetical protein